MIVLVTGGSQGGKGHVELILFRRKSFLVNTNTTRRVEGHGFQRFLDHNSLVRYQRGGQVRK